jgi:transposase
MTKVEKVAGIDISKYSLDVCVITGESERQRSFTNDLQGFKELYDWIGQEMHCVMEVTGPYYLRVASYLHLKGLRVSVVNPLVIKRFCQMRLIRAKTDKADAKMIALYGLSETLVAWSVPDDCIITLQQLDGIGEQLSKQYTALHNQLEAFTHSGAMQKQVKQFLLKAIRDTGKQQAVIQTHIDDLIARHYSDLMKNLTSIPGLGKKTATVLIVLTGGFKKFSSAKQLSAYVGLAPRIFQSGTSVKGRSRICKMGMSRVRALLYLCAWSAKRCNKACKELYERLLAKGKAKRAALIAVANKLLKQAFAIAKSNQCYTINYSKNICL